MDTRAILLIVSLLVAAVVASLALACFAIPTISPAMFGLAVASLSLSGLCVVAGLALSIYGLLALPSS
jgi:hypothetical protein